ncbi:carbohydrate kinase [Pedobacter heparinus]|uniref:carbohydrate kinase family protein n=1 Tax=Pedobacter heparinus TaxID=984 RepID=UPI00292CB93D|nr:carbohydrate kinase [Pedobacter heparinus]
MNNNQKKDINVICFGEVLWDNLPSGRKPGGAPMNVAYHLNKLGIKGTLISRVGDDQDGRDLIDVLAGLAIDVQYCQVDRLNKTSTVEVNITATHEAEYDIVFPVAWDFMEHHASFDVLVEQSDAIVFGSLASRNEVTRNTLLQLIDRSRYRVLDVNLRAPHYNKNIMEPLLGMANLLKLNTQELFLLTDWYHSGPLTEKERVKLLQSKFKIDEILVTKGGEGSVFYHQNEVYHQSAFAVEVKDTVGSGDSFLAAFLAKRLSGFSIVESLSFASCVAGFITTKNGACPNYQVAELESFNYLPG